MPATAFGVATYIFEKNGPLPHMKLQKLACYSQAESAVWNEKPWFEEKIEAWANGPVVPSLFRQLQGSYLINTSDWGPDTADNLDAEATNTIDQVVEYYSDKNPQWLSKSTRMEQP